MASRMAVLVVLALVGLAASTADECRVAYCKMCYGPGIDGFGGEVAGAWDNPLVCEAVCVQNATNTHYNVYDSDWCRCYTSCNNTMHPQDPSGVIYTVGCLGDEAGITCPNSTAVCAPLPSNIAYMTATGSAGSTVSCSPVSGSLFTAPLTDVTCVATTPGLASSTCGFTIVVIGPVHCELSQWSDWSNCSAECDEGTRMRTRTVDVEPNSCGNQCGPLSESETCNAHPCVCDEPPTGGLCLKCPEQYELPLDSFVEGAGRNAALCHEYCRTTYPTSATNITVYSNDYCRCYSACPAGAVETPGDLSGSIYPLSSGNCDAKLIANASRCDDTHTTGARSFPGVGTAGGAGRNPSLCRAWCGEKGSKFMVVYASHFCRCYSQCDTLFPVADASALIFDISATVPAARKFGVQQSGVVQGSARAAHGVSGAVLVFAGVVAVVVVAVRRVRNEEAVADSVC